MYYLFLIIFALFVTLEANAVILDIASESVLDILAEKNYTDKGPKSNYVNPPGQKLKGHNYTQFYNFYFKSIKNDVFNLLEIGFFKGGSARMWKEYFSNANLFFLEINQEYIDLYGKDFKVFHVDQSNKKQLKVFARSVKNGFDIIIDDGSHIADHQIISFETLFPFLNKGGVYVIEDIHCTYNRPFMSGKSKTIEFLKNRINDVNYISKKTHCADQDKFPKNLLYTLNIYQRDILGIHFYSGICFIFKR